MVNFEISLQPAGDGLSIFDEEALPTLETLAAYEIAPRRLVETKRLLQENGITVHSNGRFTISASADDNVFQEFFGTELATVNLSGDEYVQDLDLSVQAPRGRIEPPSIPGLAETIERVYVQHDPILFARSIPPTAIVAGPDFRLRVPGDVAQLMGAADVHRDGVTGQGVKVAMVDSGFFPHPYFLEQGYDLLAVPAPDVVNATDDPAGHGTGESANLFATAPGINFIGVKMNNPTLAFRTAVELRPDIITCSWGYHVDHPGTTMPNWLKPLYLEILNAVAQGIIVCFSAGNGHLAFPANMPQVIAVGGTMVHADLVPRATTYTSCFVSNWFAGRRVPDVTGLCGERPRADYIVLPVQDAAAPDQGGGWGAFSGTSAASPMVAGVCALLKAADPSVGPVYAKHVLQATATDITTGNCAHGHAAAAGVDLATGYGLVNAKRAYDAVV